MHTLCHSVFLSVSGVQFSTHFCQPRALALAECTSIAKSLALSKLMYCCWSRALTASTAIFLLILLFVEEKGDKVILLYVKTEISSVLFIPLSSWLNSIKEV